MLNSDYSVFTAQPLFVASSTIQNGDIECGTLSIVDDGALEGPHEFTVGIASTTPSLNIDPAADDTTVEITDNDGNFCMHYTV